jgi:DNA-binding transcriptional regulator GbsR (MarR family)
LKISSSNKAREIRLRLAESGGLTAQELGFGRIPGQVLVYLYLYDGDCPLEQIEQDLGLSKAAVSIAARQLERLGLLRRVHKNGIRKRYYRTADNLGSALQAGVLSVLRRKMDMLGHELDQVCASLSEKSDREDADLQFLDSRVRRAKVLRDRLDKILNNRLLQFLGR